MGGELCGLVWRIGGGVGVEELKGLERNQMRTETGGDFGKVMSEERTGGE